MRRRDYLRSAVGAAGLAGLTGNAPVAAGSDDGESPSTATGTDAGSDDGGFAPLARLDVSNGQAFYQTTEAVMEPGGRYAFASRLDGFYVVDCADPEAPEIVGSYTGIESPDGRAVEGILDLKYNRDRLLLATGMGGAFQGIALYDVSDPTAPEMLKSHETSYSIHNADLHGEYAYLTTGRELDIVHVAPDEPESVARWSVADYDEAYAELSFSLVNLHDIYVQGERAYLAYWDAGTWIVDVSDPTAPAHLGHASDYTVDELAAVGESERFEHSLEPEGNDHYAQPNDDGTLLAVGGESWNVESESPETDEPDGDDPGGPSGIVLWDVADPANPDRLSEIEAPDPPEGETARRRGGYYTTSHNFEIVGDYLYSSWYRGGVKVHDLSDPANPEELAHWADGDAASFWTARAGVPGEFFVATSLRNPTDDDAPGGFYTFPDPSDNAATVTPSGAAVGPSGSTPTETPTATATDTPTATASPTPTPESTGAETPTDAATDTATDASSESGPGLGVLSGLAALGIGAWRLRGRDDGE